MVNSAEVGARDVVRSCVGQRRRYRHAQGGCWAVSDEAERSMRPSRGPGRIQHPLPDLSAPDAAKITRLLAGERAELEAESSRSAPDQPARASRLPSSMPHAFLPAHREAVAEAPRGSGAPPWKGPAAEPSWHVLGTMVGLRADGEGGALGLMSLTEQTATEQTASELGAPSFEAGAPSSEAGAPSSEAGEAPAGPPDPAIAAVRETFA